MRLFSGFATGQSLREIRCSSRSPSSRRWRPTTSRGFAFQERPKSSHLTDICSHLTTNRAVGAMDSRQRQLRLSAV